MMKNKVMSKNKIRNNASNVLLLTGMLLFLLSCGDLSDEETKDRIRFTEFFFFPTAPYIDKSYVEEVPADDVASSEIDYDAEVAAIQYVYRTFIDAYVAKNIDRLSDTFDRAASMEYGTTTGIVYGWANIKSYIQTNWSGNWAADCNSEPNWELTDFYYRPKNAKYNYTEVSAKGPMFYYLVDRPSCFSEIGKFYFTKKSGTWRIHQIDGSRYFTDPQYKVP